MRRLLPMCAFGSCLITWSPLATACFLAPAGSHFGACCVGCPPQAAASVRHSMQLAGCMAQMYCPDPNVLPWQQPSAALTRADQMLGSRALPRFRVLKVLDHGLVTDVLDKSIMSRPPSTLVRSAGTSLTLRTALQAGITSGALASAAVGAINVLGTVIAASLMDKAGRKQLLTTSFAGAAEHDQASGLPCRAGLKPAHCQCHQYACTRTLLGRLFQPSWAAL